MTTHRRRFLRLCGLITTGTIAGCTSRSQDDGTATPVRTETPTQVQTDIDITPSQQAKIAPTDGDSGDGFGNAVTVSADGTTALIGAHFDNTSHGESAGSAYVFDASGNSWTQQTKLTPSEGSNFDRFGETVALSSDGSIAVIGSPATPEENPESAYIFEATDSGWTQQARLLPSDGDDGDRFGFALTLSGDGSTAIIGAGNDTNPNGSLAGAAYVFTATDDEWAQQAKLTSTDGDNNDLFGEAVGVSNDGTTALIGAWGDDDPNGADGGSVYIFDAGDSWTQQAKLAPPSGDSDDSFGAAVSMSEAGTTALIGAFNDEGAAGNTTGSAYVYTRSGDSWSQQAKLIADDGDSGDSFGSAVSLSNNGSIAVVGTPTDADPNGGRAGSAYVFTSSGGSWSQQAKLAADDGDSEDGFGSSVTISADGTTAYAGAEHDEDPNGDLAGSSYVFGF